MALSATCFTYCLDFFACSLDFISAICGSKMLYTFPVLWIYRSSTCLPSNSYWQNFHYFLYFPSLFERGGFKFFDTTAPGKYYGGFQAQPPCIVNRKAYDFSQTMPIVLQVELLPQHRVWEDLFQNDYPDFRDIALYFLPSAIIQRYLFSRFISYFCENMWLKLSNSSCRSKDNCASLFKLMEIRNSVMRSCINDVELIIFTSNLLHGDLQSELWVSCFFSKTSLGFEFFNGWAC